MIQPLAKPNSQKYGPQGLYQTNYISEDIPEELASLLSLTANFSLTQSTWSTYTTALSQLRKCSTELNISLELPLTEKETLTFVAWLLKKNLLASTIESYLAGLRQGQIAAGLGDKPLRTPLVNQVIKGRKNQVFAEPAAKDAPERLPITPKILLLIKKDLKTSNMTKHDKLATWAACTLLFYGAFRGGELLPKQERNFDPLTTLLLEDISIQNIKVKDVESKVLQIQLKTEKANKHHKPNIVDVYANKSESCPIAAWRKYNFIASNQVGLPAFRKSDGSNLTAENLNKYLKTFNQKYLNIPGKTLSTHSFRAGLATVLGSLGFSDDQIKSTGRWSSRSFELYCKLPRSKRMEMARSIAAMDL